VQIPQSPRAEHSVTQTPVPVTQTPGVRQPVPVTQTPGVRQPIPVTQTPGVRQPIPVTQTPGIRQPIPVTQTPGIRQPIPVTQTPGVRQPIPVTQTPGVRQPIPVTQTPGVRQPIPVTQTSETANPLNEQPQEQNNENIWDTASTDNKGDPIVGDTDPLPDDGLNNDQAQAPSSRLPTLPAPNTPAYSEMSPEEQAQHRANFRTRFGILRNAWPNYHIPDVPDSMPLEQVHAQYDIYVRHIHISRDVDQYKVYLVIMWLLIELFCTKIGLNIGGYTVAQMRSMNKYERLLIELGETNYKASAAEAAAAGSSWPVEVRIFFMALVNAVTFIIIKMLASYIGEGMATTIIDGLSSYLSGSPPQPGQVLFGGPAQSTAVGSQGPPAGGVPLPQTSSPFGGIDVPSMLANFGSMFIRGQSPMGGGAQPAPTAAPAATTSVGPQTPTAPRFTPAYDD
jgi:hypothetical protein